ncbi:hypothetical protein SAMN05518871_101259 [Psychrobacillus sp. OK028]|nr:hypothetical protein SAMN05518871_101259 [Psychrobacillus sp. OK028]
MATQAGESEKVENPQGAKRTRRPTGCWSQRLSVPHDVAHLAFVTLLKPKS